MHASVSASPPGSSSLHSYGSQPAFWNICVGGVGASAGRYLQSRYRTDDQPFAMALLQLDTDPATSIDSVETVRIQLTISDVRAMRANPFAFGETATTIIHDF